MARESRARATSRCCGCRKRRRGRRNQPRKRPPCPASRQKPSPSGGSTPPAGQVRHGQCRGRQVGPEIVGSARPGWLPGRARQKPLAVPEPGGIGGLRARNPWQCQSWMATARNPWQCQRSVAPLPRTPDASCPSRRRGGHYGPPWRSLLAKSSSAFCRTMRAAP